MKVLPRDEFEKFIYDRAIAEGVDPTEAAFDAMTTGATYLLEEEEIVVPEGTSTKKKLHELGHKGYRGPRLEYRPMGSVALEEILAEKYAWDVRGKRISSRVGLPALLELNYGQGLSPSESVEVVVRVLRRDLGVSVTRRDKKFMYSYLRRYGRVV